MCASHLSSLSDGVILRRFDGRCEPAAKGAAASGDNVQVVGMTGMWDDATGYGLSGDDSFGCTGNGSAELYIK